MYLRDISIQADKSIASHFKGGFVSLFARDVSCCISLFLSLIDRKIETKGTKKIVITFTNDKYLVKKKHHMYPEQPDVLIFTWLFPFEKYVGATDLAKKRMIFSSMHDCVKYLANQYRWDIAPLDDAKKKAEQDQYQFNGYLKHSWLSPNSKWRVKLFYDYGLEFLEFYCCLFKNRSKTELCRHFMGRVVPVQGSCVLKKSDGKWLSDSQFELISPSFHKKKWVVDLKEFIDH